MNYKDFLNFFEKPILRKCTVCNRKFNFNIHQEEICPVCFSGGKIKNEARLNIGRKKEIKL